MYTPRHTAPLYYNLLTGLCMLSIHRQKILDLNLVQNIVDEFKKNKLN